VSKIFGGFFIDPEGRRQQLPILVDPDESKIEKILKENSDKGCVIVLRQSPELEGQPYELTLYSENNNYLITLSERDANFVDVIKTLNCVNASNDLVTILGEKYPAKHVTNDFNVVYEIFHEFSKAGNVSSMT